MTDPARKVQFTLKVGFTNGLLKINLNHNMKNLKKPKMTDKKYNI